MELTNVNGHPCFVKAHKVDATSVHESPSGKWIVSIHIASTTLQVLAETQDEAMRIAREFGE